MNKENSKHSTILVIVLGLLVLSFIFKASTLVTVATIIGVVSLIFPIVGSWIEFVWFKLAEGLGWVNSRLILGIVFFVILFPIAFLYRLVNSNTLKLRKGEKSLFESRDHTYTKEDFENMW